MTRSPHRLVNTFLNGVLIAVPLLFLILSWADQTSPVRAPVQLLSGGPDTLQSFPGALIREAGELYVQAPSPALRMLAPRSTLDTGTTLILFLGAVVVVIFFRDFSYEHPFTRKAYLGLQSGFWILIVYMIADFIRQDWFDSQVRQLTGGLYAYRIPPVPATPEFWILFILLRLIWIFKKGLSLQSDADLTV